MHFINSEISAILAEWILIGLFLYFIFRKYKKRNILIIFTCLYFTLFLVKIIIIKHKFNNSSIQITKKEKYRYLLSSDIYLVKFAPSIFQKDTIYNNPSTFSEMHLQYQADENGFVIGDPKISFKDGIQTFKFVPFSTTPVEHDYKNQYSTFNIYGSADFNISFIIQYYTWSLPTSMKIKVFTNGQIKIESSEVQEIHQNQNK